MKHLIKQFVLTASVVFVSTSISAYDFEAKNTDGIVIYYSKLSDGYSVEVANKSTTTFATSIYEGEITIPEIVLNDGLEYAVTGIGDYAFYKSKVTKVNLPNTITSIGYVAFENSTILTEINLPKSVKTMGQYAFNGCSSLKEIELPSISVLELGSFYNCKSITEITIPKTVMKIMYSTRTTASGSDTYMGVFYGCSSLKKVKFEDGDRSITMESEDSFTTTNKLNERSIFYGCPIETLYIGRDLYGAPFREMTSITNIEFGSYVTYIENSAFYGCTGIRTLFIPNSVTSFGTKNGGHSFANCSSLETVYIGNGIEDLGYATFDGCSSLKNVFIGNSLTSIRNYVFNTKSTPNIYIFSKKLNSVDEYAFGNTGSKPNCIYVPSTQDYLTLLANYNCCNLLTFNETTAKYTGMMPTLSYKNNVPNTIVSFESIDSPTDVGTYSTNLQTTFTIDKWKTTVEIPCTYTITPAAVTIIADDQRREYGKSNPQFTCSYFGFVNDEDETCLTASPTISTTAKQNSYPGTYPIIVTNAQSKNYEFSYERGVLTIVKAKQTLTWSQEIGELSVGDDVEIILDCSNNEIEPSFFNYDTNVVKIAQQDGIWKLSAVGVGETTIYVKLSASECYEESSTLYKVVSVNNNSTGINEVSHNAMTNCTIYDISGKRLKTPQRGLNIINGKKVVIK